MEHSSNRSSEVQEQLQLIQKDYDRIQTLLARIHDLTRRAIEWQQG